MILKGGLLTEALMGPDLGGGSGGGSNIIEIIDKMPVLQTYRLGDFAFEFKAGKSLTYYGYSMNTDTAVNIQIEVGVFLVCKMSGKIIFASTTTSQNNVPTPSARYATTIDTSTGQILFTNDIVNIELPEVMNFNPAYHTFRLRVTGKTISTDYEREWSTWSDIGYFTSYYNTYSNISLSELATALVNLENTIASTENQN